MSPNYLLWLQRLRESSGDVLSPVLMWVSDIMVGLVPVCVVAFVYLCVSKRWGYYIMASVFAATTVNQCLKNTFCVYRPWIRCSEIQPYADSALKATGYSFPSGHASTAASFFGAFASMLRQRRWAVWACAVCALVVCFSRNYLGVHTPEDVLTGIAEGLAAVWIVDRYVRVRRDGRRDAAAVVMGLVAVGAVLTYATLKPYPVDLAADGSILVDPMLMITDCYVTAGLMTGFLTGWYVEKHYICMPQDRPWWKYLWRIALAVTLILIHSYLFVPVLHSMLGNDWGAFVQCLIMVWIVTIVVPYYASLE